MGNFFFLKRLWAGYKWEWGPAYFGREFKG